MARNGTGTYSLPEAAFVSGTSISSTAVNTNFSDIAAALTASIAKDGQTAATANLPMGGYIHTGVGNATARTHYAAAGQVVDGALTWGGTAGGTGDAMTLTMSPGITAYATGMRVSFVKNASANTGAATLNINSVGAKSIVRADGSTALDANELPASSLVEVIYDGTSFRLVGKPILDVASDVLGVLAAVNGGTNNAYTEFTGPTTSTKTFTLPNASATLHTSAGQAAGTAAAPAYSFSSDTNSGMYSSGADALGFSTGGTVRIAVESNGCVGVPSVDAGTQFYVVAASGNTGVQSEVANTANAALILVATSESYANNMQFVAANRAASSDFNFYLCNSDHNGTSDTEFKLAGDGNGFCDGAWYGGGADYAEFFEWLDGNPQNEDRRGLPVVIDQGKIRVASSDDAASAIIGVVTGNPSVVGDAAWNRWSGKYLCDDYASYLMEAYEVWAWSELDEDGRRVEHSYPADAVPPGVVVPADKTVTQQQRRKLNPAYDPALPYTPRAERPEWAPIGLLGKLRLRTGQPVGERWLKLRDISAEVEEWLVR